MKVSKERHLNKSTLKITSHKSLSRVLGKARDKEIKMAYYNAKDIEWLAEILKDDHHANIEFRSKQEINATISTDVLRSSFSTDRLSIRRTDCSLFLESSSRYQSFAIEVTINMLGINAEFKDGEITIPIASGKLKIGIRR